MDPAKVTDFVGRFGKAPKGLGIGLQLLIGTSSHSCFAFFSGENLFKSMFFHDSQEREVWPMESASQCTPVSGISGRNLCICHLEELARTHVLLCSVD